MRVGANFNCFQQLFSKRERQQQHTALGPTSCWPKARMSQNRKGVLCGSTKPILKIYEYPIIEPILSISINSLNLTIKKVLMI